MTSYSALINMSEIRLDHNSCRVKAAECEEMAKQATRPDHRVMLKHMAETWTKICADLKRSDTN